MHFGCHEIFTMAHFTFASFRLLGVFLLPGCKEEGTIATNPKHVWPAGIYPDQASPGCSECRTTNCSLLRNSCLFSFQYSHREFLKTTYHYRPMGTCSQYHGPIFAGFLQQLCQHLFEPLAVACGCCTVIEPGRSRVP